MGGPSSSSTSSSSSGTSFREIERNVLLSITFVLLAYLGLKQSRSTYFWSSSATTKSSTTSKILMNDISSQLPKGKFASGAPIPSNMAPKTYHYDEMGDRAFGGDDSNNMLHGVTVHPFAPHPAKDITCNNAGFSYVQIQENTGWMSTTPPSAHYRMAQKLGCSSDADVKILDKSDNHHYNKGDKSSFRWTTIQEPTNRLLYKFFYSTVSNEKNEPNDKNFHELFEKYNVGSQLMERLAPKPSAEKETEGVIAQHVTAIMNDFDFVAVQERMEESLVAMAMLMDMSMRDIMHLAPAMVGFPGTPKKLGHFVQNMKNPTKCTYIIPAFVSPGLEAYFETPKYQNSVKGERILYNVANKALNMTIDTLNKNGEFSANLNIFRYLQAWALYTCQDEPSIADATQFPCMRNGKYNTELEAECVQDDVGCGFSCLDKVANEKLNF